MARKDPARKDHARKQPSAKAPKSDAALPLMPEGMEDAPAVKVDGVLVDLDDDELPGPIRKAAFSSGGFPYDKKMSSEDGEAALVPLQIELLKLQAWLKSSGERIAILFEGRDGAGKGGTIDRFTEHLNPRNVMVVALSKPSPDEAGQWYFQRYVSRLPSAGHIALFDRSWYNRGVVEPVMGFCTEEQAKAFLDQAPTLERLFVDDGLRLFKFWLTIGREMQLERLHARRHDPLKRWKLSPIDYAGLDRWDAYTLAAERMLTATHTAEAPWTVIKANDKRRLRIEAMRHVLLNVPYAGRDLDAIGEPDRKIVMSAEAFLAEGGEE